MLARFLLSFVVVLTVAWLAWGSRAEGQAEADARAFCASVRPGADFAAVVARAAGLGDRRLYRATADSLTVGFTGLPPFSRHSCVVSATAGRVSSAEYRHLD